MSSILTTNFLKELDKINIQAEQEISIKDIKEKINDIISNTSKHSQHLISDETKKYLQLLVDSNPEFFKKNFKNFNNFNDFMHILMKKFLDCDLLKDLFLDSLKNKAIDSKESIMCEMIPFISKGTRKSFRSVPEGYHIPSPSLYKTVTTDYLYCDKNDITKLDNFINIIMNEFNIVNETIYTSEDLIPHSKDVQWFEL
jgi:hypothetical protein